MTHRRGPGFLVAAAFIGPGTVTTASLAGAGYGYTLAWAVVCAIIATLILQDMAARLGVQGGVGLGEALRSSISARFPRILIITLALTAIVFGNAAYQAGNLTGASMGLEALLGHDRKVWVLLCAVIAAGLLATGAYRWVERVLVFLVAVMSAVFILTVVRIGPDLGALLAGLLRPSIPAGSGLVVLALVGTTVVPYNLFLHASAVREKWRGVAGLEGVREARRDSFVAISLGGLVTLAILLTAVPLYLATLSVTGVADMAGQLEPLLGAWAGLAFALGLFAAGLTSAITAPLAAAWAAAGLLGWEADMKSARFRLVWAAIILTGAGFAATGVRPVEAILAAQAANGLLLPLMAGFLLWVMNQRGIMGEACNRWGSNLAGSLVVLFSIFISITTIYRVFLL